MLSRVQGESRKTFSRLRPGVLFPSGIMSTFFPFSTGLARDFSPLELRLFLLSAPDSNLFDDSSHIFQHCFCRNNTTGRPFQMVDFNLISVYNIFHYMYLLSAERPLLRS